MPKPLPEHVGSLSKYIGAQDHYKLLAYITHDTPGTELREKFGDNLYATARARYLIVEDEVVLRDRLIDLVHEEGTFTKRVKMVMYFLFMFRDRRYREFICRVVGHNNGKWDAKVLSGKDGDFFENAGGTRAFTNLRRFLFQTGILDEGTWSVHMPDPTEWFTTAAEIAG